MIVSLVDQITSFVESPESKAIRDPLWGHVYIPRSFAPLLETKAFLKLRGILQLGPAHLVYPGATHTRFAHSLGVYWIAFRYLKRLLQVGINCEMLTFKGAQSFLLAALMHDLGHFPYTHSLKELPLLDHEELTAQLIQEAEISNIISSLGLNVVMLSAIVDHAMPLEDKQYLFYRQLLSGVLDPDKLDYLKRDAWYCGVPYGVQDLDYLLSQVFISEKKVPTLLTGAVSVVEHLLFSKYLMYKAVYWHRDVRVATAMIKRALFLGLRNKKILARDLYNLDDAEFFLLAQNRDYAPFDLIELVKAKKLFEVIFEVSFSDLNVTVQEQVMTLETRSQLELAIANAILEPGFSEYDLIMDVPENISFEQNFPIGEYRESSTELNNGSVFTGSVVEEFTQKLRIARIMVSNKSLLRSGDYLTKIKTMLQLIG